MLVYFLTLALLIYLNVQANVDSDRTSSSNGIEKEQKSGAFSEDSGFRMWDSYDRVAA